MRAVSLRGASDVPVRVLILDNVTRDVEMAEAALTHADVRFVSRRVATRADFVRELTAFAPDLVLADDALPKFSGLEALRLVRSLGPDLPFIVVTRPHGEEAAVECMKAGADDYVLKTSLGRLPAATLNALGKRAAGRGRQAAEEALRRSEAEYRLVAESIRDLVCHVDRDGTLLYASASFADAVPSGAGDLTGRDFAGLVHPADRELARSAIRRALAEDEPQVVELRFDTRGEPRPFESVINRVRGGSARRDSLVIVSRDVARRQALSA